MNPSDKELQELREQLLHLNGGCLPTDHKCTYEPSRNDTQILDMTMQLIQAYAANQVAKAERAMLDRLDKRYAQTLYPDDTERMVEEFIEIERQRITHLKQEREELK